MIISVLLCLHASLGHGLYPAAYVAEAAIDWVFHHPFSLPCLLSRFFFWEVMHRVGYHRH